MSSSSDEAVLAAIERRRDVVNSAIPDEIPVQHPERLWEASRHLLDAERVGLCSTVDGVLDGDGAVVPTVRAFEDVADALGGSDATDVTGGMAGKVRALLELDVPASVFGRADLPAFLAGGQPGTTVE